MFLRWRLLLGHHDGLPGQRRRHLQEPGRGPPCPQDRQIRLQVAARWVTAPSLARSDVVQFVIARKLEGVVYIGVADVSHGSRKPAEAEAQCEPPEAVRILLLS